MCYHTEIEVADQTLCLTQSQYTDTGPTSHISDLKVDTLVVTLPDTGSALGLVGVVSVSSYHG